MNSKKHRSASIYLFVIKTWIEHLFLTKFKKKFYSEPKYESIRIHFLKRKGKETKHLFFAMGGVYIKIGQFVSNLFHILPEEFLWELQDLQDKIPPREFEEINERWLYDYKKSMDTIFTDLDKTSYASASTAQVHIGYYNGKKVAIKTLYPKIEEDAIRDLKTISRVIWLIDRFVFKVSAKEVNEQLNTMIRSELDLRSELKNLKYTKQLFALEKDFFFPTPIEELCNKHTLVTEFVEGKKIYEIEPLDSYTKKNPNLEKLIRAYILMIFEYRFFHADPHPGNLIFMETGELCFIDFGAVQSISEEETRILERILIGAMRKDYHLITESLFELGAVTESLSKEELIQIVKYSLEKLNRILDSTDHFRNISFDTLRPAEDLRFLKEIQVSLKRLLSSLKLPPNFLSLHRVLALLLGNSSYLDPTRSMIEYAEKPFSQIVLKGSSLKKLWKDEGEEFITSLFSLPKELNEFLYKWNRGEFQTPDSSRKEELRLKEIFTFGALGSIFFFFGMYYSEKFWKEPSILFYILSGLSFWSLAKSSLSYWKQK
ncbi:AarF/ABC1/UbiB kinase family protein [Leptospira bourretii]|uniref:AarF/ABC1/UbiB kinase family protein n=1 Tax=Leptospira bourretii TaxID=2484962 RepID=A0A4R9IKB6_9LEPT|nr:AarF/UbiB family protein [Leptospira bourretii]TGK79683.1 AarF/ABC1/UbiB kinase family protein [Leptospira bourretii]TGK89893.1 AarF/ABC1/UbiB kinase family protein [Leptospira bourretii]TGL19345.1 AarF/ABC1/UbiB kinase family protein [Leptospira bourretii]TGL29153.1 AarF/ABC1/UbiB kinase family protein [Leptospira bourretii]